MAVSLVFFFLQRHPATPIVALAFAAMIGCIALTWGSIGKFVVPVLPMAGAMVAALLVGLVAWIRRTLKKT